MARAPAAIDVRDFAHNEAGRQVEYCVDDVRDLPHTAERVWRAKIRMRLKGIHWRLYDVQRDRVHPGYRALRTGSRAIWSRHSSRPSSAKLRAANCANNGSDPSLNGANSCFCNRRRSRRRISRPGAQIAPRSAARTFWRTPTPSAAPTRARRAWTVRTSRRSRRMGSMAGRTGACAQAGDLPTGSNQARVHTEGQRQTQAAWHLNLAAGATEAIPDRPVAAAGARLLAATE